MIAKNRMKTIFGIKIIISGLENSKKNLFLKTNFTNDIAIGL